MEPGQNRPRIEITFRIFHAPGRRKFRAPQNGRANNRGPAPGDHRRPPGGHARRSHRHIRYPTTPPTLAFSAHVPHSPRLHPANSISLSFHTQPDVPLLLHPTSVQVHKYRPRPNNLQVAAASPSRQLSSPPSLPASPPSSAIASSTPRSRRRSRGYTLGPPSA